MTIISRSKLDHPTLGEAGGSSLHTTMENLYTKLGDDSNSRFFTADALANAASVNFDHNFKTAFSELSYNLYLRNTGTGELTLITETSTPSIYQFSLVARTSFETTQVTLTNSSGSTRDIALVLNQISLPTFKTAGLVKKTDFLHLDTIKRQYLTNWIQKRNHVAIQSLDSICVGNGIFVAVASNGTANRAATSPDGINWTSRDTTGFDNTWNSVCFGNNTFVAVGSDGTGNSVMKSTDNGATWSTSSTTGFDNTWNSVCFGNNTFVAVASTGTGNRLMKSTDNGATWSTSSTTDLDYEWKNVCYSKKLNTFIAVSLDGFIMLSNDNGVTWVDTAATGITAGLESVCYSEELELFIAGSTNPSRLFRSANGTSWTQITLSGAAGSGKFESVIWCKELSCFVAFVSQSSALNKNMWYSFDGTSWEISNFGDNGLTYYSVAWNNVTGCFVAVGNQYHYTSAFIKSVGGYLPSGRGISGQAYVDGTIGFQGSVNGSLTSVVSGVAQEGGNAGVILPVGKYLVFSNHAIGFTGASAITQIKYGVGTATGNNFTGSTDFNDERPSAYTPSAPSSLVSPMQIVNGNGTTTWYPKIMITGTVGTTTVTSSIKYICIG
jgi:hypothetical protein